MDKKKFDYQTFHKQALDSLLSGGKLSGADGILAPLIQNLLQEALEAEMDVHQQDSQGNRRNGRGRKKVQTTHGEIELEPPRDRDGSFEPEIVPKRSRILAEGLEQKVISLYASGLGYRDIRRNLEELYGLEVSEAKLSQITDRVIPLIHEWQSRPLDTVYAVVWMDAIHFKVRIEGQVQQRAIYCILGVNSSGLKDVLGMYLFESEGAGRWLQVLENLRNRGVGDILIACIDNLRGFAEAVELVFPLTDVQLCVIHQVRNSLRYVSWKDSRELMRDLKEVYRAGTIEQAGHQLTLFRQKWGARYRAVVDSWERNWERLTQYFKYPAEVRKIIYTTNTVEGYHRQIRKVTKTKGAFPTEMAIMKLVFLAYQEIAKKWGNPIRDWPEIRLKLNLHFSNRFPIEI